MLQDKMNGRVLKKDDSRSSDENYNYRWKNQRQQEKGVWIFLSICLIIKILIHTLWELKSIAFATGVEQNQTAHL